MSVSVCVCALHVCACNVCACNVCVCLCVMCVCVSVCVVHVYMFKPHVQYVFTHMFYFVCACLYCLLYLYQVIVLW